MTVYATFTDLTAYAVGLNLPQNVQGALDQGNHWVSRQVERADVDLSSEALLDARYAACAYALAVLAGFGLIAVGEQSAESLELGPLKFKLSKAPVQPLPNFQAQAAAHLVDAGVTAALEDQPEIVTGLRRRW